MMRPMNRIVTIDALSKPSPQEGLRLVKAFSQVLSPEKRKMLIEMAEEWACKEKPIVFDVVEPDAVNVN